MNAARGQRVGSLPIGGSEWRLPDGTTLDVLESDATWASEAIRLPRSGPEGLPIIDLPYLVLMKMFDSRGIDIGDLTRMLGGADGKALDMVRAAISTHMSEAAEDLESLIALGKLEYEQDSRL